MDDTINVVTHAIDDIEHWPVDVTDIWHSLSYPLPKSLTSDNVRKCLSPLACEIYDEVLQSLPTGFEDQDEMETSGRTVIDIINTILSHVSRVRAARSLGCACDEARLGWISILSVLGIAASDDALLW